MSFNLKKQSQKKRDSVLPNYKGMDDLTDKHDLSLSKSEFVPNFNTILETDRRPLREPVMLHEALLEDKRKKAQKADLSTEGQLNEADSPLFPHRQTEENKPQSVMPINALTEAFDRKYREAFSKLNKDADTEFWDKYIGVQLDGKMTKVPSNIKETGSQLPNNPSRFGNLDGLPHESDAATNRDRRGKSVEIKPMQGFKGGEKPWDLKDSLREADKMMYKTYLLAASENRDLTASEKELIEGINQDKRKMLLAQINPNPIDPMDPNQPQPNINPQPIEGVVNPEDRDTDFLDGGQNPTAGDPALWGQLSGVQEPVEGLNEEVKGVDMESPIPAMDGILPKGGEAAPDHSTINPERVDVNPEPQLPGVSNDDIPF